MKQSYAKLTHKEMEEMCETKSKVKKKPQN